MNMTVTNKTQIDLPIQSNAKSTLTVQTTTTIGSSAMGSDQINVQTSAKLRKSRPGITEIMKTGAKAGAIGGAATFGAAGLMSGIAGSFVDKGPLIDKIVGAPILGVSTGLLGAAGGALIGAASGAVGGAVIGSVISNKTAAGITGGVLGFLVGGVATLDLGLGAALVTGSIGAAVGAYSSFAVNERVHGK